MFNVGGGELLIILFVALVVLGPDKLPDAARKIGNVMGEVRRMSAGFQDEIRSAMDAPQRAVQSVKDAVTQPSETTAEPPEPLVASIDDDDIRPVDPTGGAGTSTTEARRDDPAA